MMQWEERYFTVKANQNLRKHNPHKQGYKAREDESLGMRTGKESGKKQSMKDRRDESYGAWGKRGNQKINKKHGGSLLVLELSTLWMKKMKSVEWIVKLEEMKATKRVER